MALMLISPSGVNASELEYKTHFLFTWVSSCTQQIAPELIRRGVPMPYAMNLASVECSCIIDHFREMPFQELMQLKRTEIVQQSRVYGEFCTASNKSL